MNLEQRDVREVSLYFVLVHVWYPGYMSCVPHTHPVPGTTWVLLYKVYGIYYKHL